MARSRSGVQAPGRSKPPWLKPNRPPGVEEAPAGSPDIRRLIAPFGRTGYVGNDHFEPGSVTVLRIFHAREDRQRQPPPSVDLADPIRYRLLARATEFQP